MEEDLWDVNFVPDYDPSSESQSEEWITLDEVMSDTSIPGDTSTQDVNKEGQSPTASSTEDTRTVVLGALCSGSTGPRAGKYSCPICGTKLSGHVKRHVLRTHLPWFWVGTLACWECRQLEGSTLSLAVKHTLAHKGQQRLFDDENLHEWCQLFNGSLHLLREWLGLDSLECLRQFASSSLYDSVVGEFNTQETQLMSFYSTHYSEHRVAQFKLKPLNHVACFLHWQAVGTLLKGLSMEQQEMFRQHQQRLLENGMTIDRPFTIAGNPVMARIVDSHFHLDQILRRTNFKTWFELEQQFGGRVQVLHAVANYVFPRQWESWQEHILDAKNISVFFGIHPHAADLAEQYLDRLMDLITHQRCVAIGEVGIDLTTNCRCNPCVRPEACRERLLQAQQDFLADALNLARDVGKPVILHCRDDGSGEAAKRTLDMIRMMDMTHHAFHRHCFTGSVEELRQWEMELPAVKFGVTMRSAQDPNLVARIPVERLLLETDAPYLLPAPGCKMNHPWNLASLAAQVASIRNTPVSFILETCNNNARQFYRLYFFFLIMFIRGEECGTTARLIRVRPISTNIDLPDLHLARRLLDIACLIDLIWRDLS
ncbi:uncharacterized protein LOC134273368, partial [Saccostrea cucullata]|uniref:uncharacterized protein LOC134273368 n=1 Tax=Saccostrea cuccullata TaxID=36930 RepID=UPI002ED2D593